MGYVPISRVMFPTAEDIECIITLLAQGAIKRIEMLRLVWIFSPFFLDIFSIQTC